MGNAQQNRWTLYEDSFEALNEKDAEDISENYKVLPVWRVGEEQVNNAMYADKYFESQPEKIQAVHDMAEYCQTHKQNWKYTTQTNYVCNKKEQLCICNVTASTSWVNTYMKVGPVVLWVKKRDELL